MYRDFIQIVSHKTASIIFRYHRVFKTNFVHLAGEHFQYVVITCRELSMTKLFWNTPNRMTDIKRKFIGFEWLKCQFTSQINSGVSRKTTIKSHRAPIIGAIDIVGIWPVVATEVKENREAINKGVASQI